MMEEWDSRETTSISSFSEGDNTTLKLYKTTSNASDFQKTKTVENLLQFLRVIKFY